MSNADEKAQEQLILRVKPSSASIVLQPLRAIVALVGGFILLWLFVPPSYWRDVGLAALLALLVLRVAWRAIWVFCARYELTTRRVRVITGVFSRLAVEIPLARLQNTAVSKSFFERLAGIGTIGLSSAGSDGFEVIWEMIDDPDGVLARVRDAADSVRGDAGLGDASAPRPVVLGLVGGIGAGKSAVARELAARGAIVLDSDTQAKRVLETPEVKAKLVEWWGPDVVRQGAVDRKRVADIVFADPAQRRRLESLIHPKLRHERQDEIQRAGERGVRLAVIDAPLLLEAGVDSECDAVVFVEAPREQRLARVRSRGWDEAELDRREAAQWPLDRKRAAAAFVVLNDADAGQLPARVDVLLRQVETKYPRLA
ncbi:MAG: dephospho-CoA kinase [Phycisphaerales bacterium]